MKSHSFPFFFSNQTTFLNLIYDFFCLNQTMTIFTLFLIFLSSSAYFHSFYFFISTKHNLKKISCRAPCCCNISMMCQAIASPSRSGSDARIRFSALSNNIKWIKQDKCCQPPMMHIYFKIGNIYILYLYYWKPDMRIIIWLSQYKHLIVLRSNLFIHFIYGW